MPRGDRPVYCSTVKRLMTNGYDVDLIGRQWGIRPCLDEAVVQGLRDGSIPPGPHPEEESLGANAPSSAPARRN